MASPEEDIEMIGTGDVNELNDVPLNNHRLQDLNHESSGTLYERAQRGQQELETLESKRQLYVKFVGQIEEDDPDKAVRMNYLLNQWIRREHIRSSLNLANGIPNPGPTIPLQATARQLEAEQGYARTILERIRSAITHNNFEGNPAVIDAELELYIAYKENTAPKKTEQQHRDIRRFIDRITTLRAHDDKRSAEFKNDLLDLARRLELLTRDKIEQAIQNDERTSFEQIWAVNEARDIIMKRERLPRMRRSKGEAEMERLKLSKGDYRKYKVLKGSKLAIQRTTRPTVRSLKTPVIRKGDVELRKYLERKRHYRNYAAFEGSKLAVLINPRGVQRTTKPMVRSLKTPVIRQGDVKRRKLLD